MFGMDDLDYARQEQLQYLSQHGKIEKAKKLAALDDRGYIRIMEQVDFDLPLDMQLDRLLVKGMMK